MVENKIKYTEDFVNDIVSKLSMEVEEFEKDIVTPFLSEYANLKKEFSKVSISPIGAKKQYIALFVPLDKKIDKYINLLKDKEMEIRNYFNQRINRLKNRETFDYINNLSNEGEKCKDIISQGIIKLESLKERLNSLKHQIS